MTHLPYVLGHSTTEIRRLMVQAAILKPITRRLLREAGLGAGMRVVDIGCGAGDVTMLAAELVGPHGTVVGVDRNPDVLEVARSRAQASGHSNIEFVLGDEISLAGTAAFELAIGRYVLLHQREPAELISATASCVRPGGVIAFHEVLCTGRLFSRPVVPLWVEVWDRIMMGFGSALAHPDAGARMVQHFRAAGLPQPALFCEVPTGGGPDSPLYEWAALTLHSLLPQLKKIGAGWSDGADVDMLQHRIREAVTVAGSQIEAAHQHCGWARV